MAILPAMAMAQALPTMASYQAFNRRQPALLPLPLRVRLLVPPCVLKILNTVRQLPLPAQLPPRLPRPARPLLRPPAQARAAARRPLQQLLRPSRVLRLPRLVLLQPLGKLHS